jgi:hypothetical protein
VLTLGLSNLTPKPGYARRTAEGGCPHIPWTSLIGILCKIAAQPAFYGRNDPGLWHGSVVRMKFFLCYNFKHRIAPQPLNQRPKESQKTCLQRN